MTGKPRSVDRVAQWPAHMLRLLIVSYQHIISPLFPPTCIYMPRCSEYGKVAVLRFGARRGMLLLLLRLLRCHARFQGAVDPVPTHYSWREASQKYKLYRRRD